LAADAGCSLGATFNVFDDFNAIVMAVNGRAFRKLGASWVGEITVAEVLSPNGRLIRVSND